MSTTVNTDSLMSKIWPVLISGFIFLNLTIILVGNLSVLLKGVYIAVTVLGVLALIFSKCKDGFTARLFRTSVLFGLAMGLALKTSVAIFNSFNAPVSSGNFIVDRVFFSYLHAPWQEYAFLILSFLAIYLGYEVLRTALKR